MSADADKGIAGFAPLPGGGQVSFEVRGPRSGVPVLLLMPVGGTMEQWGVFRSRLAARHRVISMDYRGTGRSSPSPGIVTSAGLADEALAVLDHLSVARAHVYGSSLGGMVATQLALRAPSRTDSLVLESTVARGLRFTRAGLARATALGACFARRGEEVEACLAAHVLSANFRTGHPEAVARIQKRIRSAPTSRTVLARYALAGALHDVRRAASGIRAPTLVLAGGEDNIVGVRAVRELHERIPDSQFVVLAGAGHALTLEQPEAVAQAVLGFLATRRD